MSYLKVLIVGQMFDKKSGGGITLSNLFEGWDINNLAVVTCNIENPDFSTCKKVYYIGASEIERGFPFNLKNPETSNSRIFNANTIPVELINKNKVSIGKLEKIKDYLITITGQIHRRRRFKLSKDFVNWLNEFSPDLIYSQLSSLELIRFVNKIRCYNNVPLALHIMDDWPISITNKQKSIFKFYWSRIIGKELKKIFNQASVLMSISQSMSDAYLSRYNKIFIPFHNPISLDSWLSKSKNDWRCEKVFKIIYTGRIGTANNNSILFISNVIDKLNQVEIKIKLDIYASNIDNIQVELFNSMKGVELKQAISHALMPDLLSRYDLLLLPLDFDKEGIEFARYSMPTKASEYMISGTPTLVFAHPKTALAQHALKHGWAYVVSDYSTEKLVFAINKLSKDENLRKEIGIRAKEYAIKNFDSKIVREKFKNALQINH